MCFGQNGAPDLRPTILKLARLRAERAQLLGFRNHAAYVLDNQMAPTPEKARQVLEDLVARTAAKTQAEANELTAALRADGITDGTLEPWDWDYYAEKVRAAKYAIDGCRVEALLRVADCG